MAAKGYKVTDAERKTRVGIAVRNLSELKKKTIEKFKLTLTPDEFNFQTQDGTMIETNDYFQTIPPQTLLIWVRNGERAETDAEILYKTIREVNEEYLSAGEKVQEFFTEKMKNKVFKLAEVLKSIDAEGAKLSTRAEHPEWFEGLDTRAKTKEDYMSKRAQDRIRTYFYKTKDELLKRPGLPPEGVRALLADLHARLRLRKFHGCYFDRRAAAAEPHLRCLCDAAGRFSCDGLWDKERCLYSPPHAINPYTSREERIVFQTWNLDHGIERSRTVIPEICRALKTAKAGASVDVKRVYGDLFTTSNLRFVHIVCHDKGAHRTMVANYVLPGDLNCNSML